MITETAIVWMLLDSHYLYAVISVGSNAWQHILAELAVCTHLFLLLCHTYVALVYEQRITLWLEFVVLEHILLLGCPYLSTEYLGSLVLHHSSHPGRNTFTATAVPINLHLVVLSVGHGLQRHFAFPHTTCKWFQFILGQFFPVGEVSNQYNLLCIRSPLTEHPSRRCTVKTEIEITRSEIRQCLTAVLCQILFPFYKVLVSSFDTQAIRGQIAVTFYQFQHMLVYYGC